MALWSPKLHRAMSPAEFLAARTRLGMTTRELAAALECTQRAVQWWESGRNPVPGPARVALRLLMAVPGRSARRRAAGTSQQCAD